MMLLVLLLLAILIPVSPAASDSRYSTYKPNYALLISKREKDDIALAVRLSGRYDFLRCSDGTAVVF